MNRPDQIVSLFDRLDPKNKMSYNIKEKDIDRIQTVEIIDLSNFQSKL